MLESVGRRYLPFINNYWQYRSLKLPAPTSGTSYCLSQLSSLFDFCYLLFGTTNKSLRRLLMSGLDLLHPDHLTYQFRAVINGAPAYRGFSVERQHLDR